MMDSYLSARCIALVVAIFAAITRAIDRPTCQNATAQNVLSNVTTAWVPVGRSPFGVAFSTMNQSIAFVGQRLGLAVLSTQSFPPQLLYSMELSPPLDSEDCSLQAVKGIGLSPEGRYLFLTTYTQCVAVVDVAKVMDNDSQDAWIATLTGPMNGGSSSLEVSTLEDNVFITQERGSTSTNGLGTVEVFQLNYPASNDDHANEQNSSLLSSFQGYIPLGVNVISPALSPDGRLMYATSEQLDTSEAQGSLSVLNVDILTRYPNKSLMKNTTAGCQTDRAIVSADGRFVWASARTSNHILAFDAEKLLADPDNALLATVQVGSLPVGLTFARDEVLIVTANAAQLPSAAGIAQVNGTLSVIDVGLALQGKSEQANLGQIESGYYPREIALSPDGKTVLVSIYGSDEVQAISVDSLP